MEIARIFYEGGYDRVACSTEGPMVLVSLFLKYKFNVPCFFFMHTDWIQYIKCTTNASQHERDRVRRLLRLLYSQFEGVFVLNSDHRDWLTELQNAVGKRTCSPHPPSRAPAFSPASNGRQAGAVCRCYWQTPVLLIACRISREKGLFDLRKCS